MSKLECGCEPVTGSVKHVHVHPVPRGNLSDPIINVHERFVQYSSGWTRKAVTLRRPPWHWRFILIPLREHVWYPLKRWLLLGMLVALVASCTASARQKTIETTVTGLRVAAVAFESYDGKHQLDIVDHASSFEDGQAKLKAYRESRKAVVDAFVTAYTALGLAVTLDSDASALAKAVQAGTQAAAAWEQLKKASP